MAAAPTRRRPRRRRTAATQGWPWRNGARLGAVRSRPNIGRGEPDLSRLLLHREQVDDEHERLAGEPVPAAGRPVSLVRRHGELTAPAHLHTGDALLPALDQPTQRELDRLA